MSKNTDVIDKDTGFQLEHALKRITMVIMDLDLLTVKMHPMGKTQKNVKDAWRKQRFNQMNFYPVLLCVSGH